MATLARATRDLERAEEAVQAAYLRALERWPVDGIPDDPAAWIYTVARNAAIDAARAAARVERDAGGMRAAPGGTRRRATRGPAGGDLEAIGWRPHGTSSTHDPRFGSRGGGGDSGGGGEDGDGDPADAWPDDRLALVFACCHPALSAHARIALTLRHVGGLDTVQVARAFLVGEAAMEQRLVRARRKVRDAGVPFAVPGRDALPERLASVLATLYLIFTTGYASATGAALSAEAIRLAKLVAVLAPGEPEARGLLALMLFQESRRPARLDGAGAVVLLPDQDRSRWDGALIAEGRRVLTGAGRGRYALQARVAAEHARGMTDWAAVAALYQELVRLDPSPVVRLNGAVAIAEASGPEAGLAAVDRAGRLGALDGYHLYWSARAELLTRVDRRAEAREAYERALELASDPADRAFLRRRLG